MTQANTSHAHPCPSCDQNDSVRWVTSTPDTDVWTCRHCGTEWTITLRVTPGASMTRRPPRILITGSRTWTDRTAIAQAISDYLHSVGTSIGGAWPSPIVVHGGARGADQLADAVARNWGWTPERHPADWDRHGRAAGYRRNAAMVALGADVCLAFIVGGSRGASHTATLAEAAGIPVQRYERKTPR